MGALNDFLREAPWPLVAGAWILLITALWLVAAIPAYLLLPSLRRAYAAISAGAARIWSALHTRWIAADAAVDDEVDALAERNQLLVVQEGHVAAWQASASKVLSPVDRLLTDLGSTLADAAALREGLHFAQEHSKQTENQAQDPQAGTAQRFAHVRIAMFLLPLFMTVLLALIVINTGMLGEILAGLGLVSPALTLAGIPIVRLVAAFLTLIESATGIAFAWAGLQNEPPPGMPRRVSVAGVLTVVAAVGFGIVEGFFYSRIAAGTEVTVTPFAGLTLTQEQIFFGWGFLLVMFLFAFGDMCLEAAILVIKGHSVTAYRKALTRLQSHAARLGALSESVRRHISEIRSNLPDASDLNPISAVLESLRADLRRLESQPPDWTRHATTAVGPAIARSLRNRVAMWMCLATTALVAFLFSSTMALELAAPTWPLSLRTSISVGLAVILAASGFLIHPADAYFRDQAGTLVRLSPITSKRMAVVLPIAVAAVVLIATPISAGSRTLSALGGWLFAVVCGAALVVTCRELSGAPSLVFVLIRRTLGIALFALHAAVWVLTVLLSWVFAVAGWLAGIVAEPVRLFRREGSPNAST